MPIVYEQNEFVRLASLAWFAATLLNYYLKHFKQKITKKCWLKLTPPEDTVDCRAASQDTVDCRTASQDTVDCRAASQGPFRPH